jgi:hypothetical protein
MNLQTFCCLFGDIGESLSSCFSESFWKTGNFFFLRPSGKGIFRLPGVQDMRWSITKSNSYFPDNDRKQITDFQLSLWKLLVDLEDFYY